MPIRVLAAMLAMTLAVGFPLVVRADREHRVRSGQTLSVLARRYRVPASAIARANGIRTTATLRIGQILVIPTGDGRSGAAGAAGADSGWGNPRQRGVVTLQRLGSRESYRGRLVDARGRPRPDARRRLTRLMRDDDGAQAAPDPRLMAILTRLSDHFGGRKVQIVSGYRRPGGYTRETSRHTQGDAVDVRIEGVPITAIRDYCRTLPSVGCGFYPRSRFVHVDVRDRATYWVDWSGPGEAPNYRRPPGANDSEADRTDAEGESAAESEGREGEAAPDAADAPAPADAPGPAGPTATE